MTMKITLELTPGEIHILGSPEPRKFHDSGDKLMLAESLIPRLQTAMAETRQKEYRAQEKRELASEAEAAIEALFGS